MGRKLFTRARASISVPFRGDVVVRYQALYLGARHHRSKKDVGHFTKTSVFTNLFERFILSSSPFRVGEAMSSQAVRPYICAVGEPSLRLCYNPDNDVIVAAQIIHGMMFHKKLTFIDSHFVNSPAFRMALQRRDKFAAILRESKFTILLNDRYSSIIDRRNALRSAGTYNNMHAPGSFERDDDLMHFDDASRFIAYSGITLGSSFTSVLQAKGMRSPIFRENGISEDTVKRLQQAMNDLLEQKRKAGDGAEAILTQGDFSRAGRDRCPLEEIWPEYAENYHVFERWQSAYYATNMGECHGLPYIFSHQHAEFMRVLNKPIAQKCEEIDRIQLTTSYLNLHNLMHIGPEYFVELEDAKTNIGAAKQAWLDALNNFETCYKRQSFDNALADLKKSTVAYLNETNAAIKRHLKGYAVSDRTIERNIRIFNIVSSTSKVLEKATLIPELSGIAMLGLNLSSVDPKASLLVSAFFSQMFRAAQEIAKQAQDLVNDKILNFYSDAAFQQKMSAPVLAERPLIQKNLEDQKGNDTNFVSNPESVALL